MKDDSYGFSKSIGRNCMGKQETLGTIWEVPQELWELIEPVILEQDPPKARGRKRADPRQMLNGIIFRLRSGCQWNRLPKELGDDSTIHRTFQRWVELDVLRQIWGVLVEECEELGGVDWEWQAADGAMGKARFGGSNWTQPDGSWQGWYQAESACGWRGRSFEHHGCWSQRP